VRSLGVEIDTARSIIRATGGEMEAVESIDAISVGVLPGHVLVRMSKVRATPARYPRDPAQRRTT
jgi:hypothetical protein